MKRYAMMLVVALMMTGTALAADEKDATEKWESKMEARSLGRYLNLSASQYERVVDICDYFNEEMARANRSTRNHEKLVRRAILGNLKLMKETLDERQYAYYLRVMNLTLRSKGIVLE